MLTVLDILIKQFISVDFIMWILFYTEEINEIIWFEEIVQPHTQTQIHAHKKPWKAASKNILLNANRNNKKKKFHPTLQTKQNLKKAETWKKD